jgi:type IX secretion system PorP/SprF family membrane protein
MLKAQDMHFSQFNEHPSLMNPALAGAGRNYRASLANKTQWKKVSTPYKSFGVSLDGKILSGSWKRADDLPKKHREQNIGRLGAGLSIYRDKAGDGDMGLTQSNLSLATFLPTGHWSFISVGLQASLALRRMDATSLVFPNQYNGTGYDADMNSGENIPFDRYRYFDFAAGALWSYGYVEKKFLSSSERRARFGAAAYHITQPNLRVIGRTSEKLFMKLVVHGDMLFSLRNSYLALAPSFLFQMQGPSKEILVGGMLKYYTSTNTHFTGMKKSTCLNYGLYYRSQDAIMLQFLLEYEEQYAIGLSYDLNISPLHKASRYRGGLEFTLRITPQEEFLYQKRQ